MPQVDVSPVKIYLSARRHLEKQSILLYDLTGRVQEDTKLDSTKIRDTLDSLMIEGLIKIEYEAPCMGSGGFAGQNPLVYLPEKQP